MFGPGEYRPDPSAGITAPADLPQPEIVLYSRNEIRQPCPPCGHSASRDKQSQRTLHDVGNLDVWCPRDLLVTSSQHYCTQCRQYFSADLSDLAPPAVNTPTACSTSPYGSWSRTAGPTSPP